MIVETETTRAKAFHAGVRDATIIMKSFLIYHISPAHSSLFYLSFTNGARGFVPLDAGSTAVSSGAAGRAALREPGAGEARSFAFIFPFPGRVFRSVRFFCFVIDPRVNDIVSFIRQVPLVVRLPMRRERRTRWTIPNMRRS